MVALDKNFVPQSEHVSSQIWCQKFFPLLGGGGGESLNKKFFWTEHVSSQIWCQKIFPLLRPGTPPPPTQKSETWDPPPENLRPGTPPENLRPGTPPQNLRPGTPLPKI